MTIQEEGTDSDVSNSTILPFCGLPFESVENDKIETKTETKTEEGMNLDLPNILGSKNSIKDQIYSNKNSSNYKFLRLESMGSNSPNNKFDDLIQSTPIHPNINSLKRKNSFDKFLAGITLLKCFIGIGILSLPYAFKMGGLLLSSVSIILVAFTAHKSMILLLEVDDFIHEKYSFYSNKLNSKCQLNLKNKDKNQIKGFVTYSEIGGILYGIPGEVLIELSLILVQFGTATGYIVFIVNEVHDYMQRNFQYDYLTEVQITTIIVMMLIPFCLLGSLKSLLFTTSIANISILGGLIAILIITIQKAEYSTNVKNADLYTIPVFFGVAVFAFEGIALLLPLRQSMADRQQIKEVVNWVMVILTIIFLLLGSICYRIYGDDVHSIITFNLPNVTVVTVIRAVYCLGIFFTFPVMVIPIMQNIERRVKSVRDGSLFSSLFSSNGDIGKCVTSGGVTSDNNNNPKELIELNSINCIKRIINKFKFNNKFKFKNIKNKIAYLYSGRFLFRSISIAIMGLISVKITHFGLFLGMIGSLFGSLIAFVIPSLLHLRILFKENDLFNNNKNNNNIKDVEEMSEEINKSKSKLKMNITSQIVMDIAIIIFGTISGALAYFFTLKEYKENGEERRSY